MGYNIMKIMTNKEGKSVHVLLTDGLSEILEVKELNQALKTAEIFNQNKKRYQDALQNLGHDTKIKYRPPVPNQVKKDQQEQKRGCYLA